VSSVVPPSIPLYARDDGQGTPVVLLHGLGGDHTVWNGVAAVLARSHRVIAPDLRGHGRSPVPAGSTSTFPEMERDVLDLLSAKDVPRAHLVGLSAGALLALQLALDAPDRWASLVVVGGATHLDHHSRAILDRWAETYRKEGLDAYVLRLAKDLFYPDWLENHLDMIDALREQQRKEQGRGVLAWGPTVRSFDLRGRLGRIRVPTRIVHAVDDQVVDPAHGRLLRQSIWGSDLKLFSQTGHLVPIERPEETALVLEEWVDRHAAPPAPA
jgi:3-oxoadipate enol-lactonase